MMTEIRAPQVVLLAWAAVSFLAALLPAGVGGIPRAVNAIVFLALGPGCALLVFLVRSLPVVVSAVIAIAVSLTVLVLSSQMLLLLGVWTYWGVAAIVAWFTVALTVMPALLWTDVNE
jgi:hypothetical protein